MKKGISDYILYLQNEYTLIIENDVKDNQKDQYRLYEKLLNYEPEE